MSVVKVDIEKLRVIAHDRRRAARAAEFAPWDIKATIPSEQAAAEAERQKIRDKYASMQQKMDAAKSVEELVKLIPKG
jgi:hypothetical protein